MLRQALITKFFLIPSLLPFGASMAAASAASSATVQLQHSAHECSELQLRVHAEANRMSHEGGEHETQLAAIWAQAEAMRETWMAAVSNRITASSSQADEEELAMRRAAEALEEQLLRHLEQADSAYERWAALQAKYEAALAWRHGLLVEWLRTEATRNDGAHSELVRAELSRVRHAQLAEEQHRASCALRQAQDTRRASARQREYAAARSRWRQVAQAQARWEEARGAVADAAATDEPEKAAAARLALQCALEELDSCLCGGWRPVGGDEMAAMLSTQVEAAHADLGASGVMRYALRLRSGGAVWVVRRRYREWHQLRATLLGALLGVASVGAPFPPKRLYCALCATTPGGKHDPRVVAERVVALRRWLAAVLALDGALEVKALREFIEQPGG